MTCKSKATKLNGANITLNLGTLASSWKDEASSKRKNVHTPPRSSVQDYKWRWQKDLRGNLEEICKKLKEASSTKDVKKEIQARIGGQNKLMDSITL